jgi:hypothetical protein
MHPEVNKNQGDKKYEKSVDDRHGVNDQRGLCDNGYGKGQTER